MLFLYVANHTFLILKHILLSDALDLQIVCFYFLLIFLFVFILKVSSYVYYIQKMHTSHAHNTQMYPHKSKNVVSHYIQIIHLFGSPPPLKIMNPLIDFISSSYMLANIYSFLTTTNHFLIFLVTIILTCY